MPSGTYALEGDVTERFSCGHGPAGWRYVATRERAGAPAGRLDVVLTAGGAVLRAQVETGGWLLRGGAVGPDLLWRRGEREHTSRAAGFTGTSPVWALAAARLLTGTPGPVRLRLVRLGDEALATRVVEERWQCTGTERRAGVDIARWEVADLETGEQRALHVAGDLLLSAPGVELVDTLV